MNNLEKLAAKLIRKKLNKPGYIPVKIIHDCAQALEFSGAPGFYTKRFFGHSRRRVYRTWHRSSEVITVGDQYELIKNILN